MKIKELCGLKPQISPPEHGQIGHVGGVLKTSGPADSKSVPGFDNGPRFVGVIEQNRISNSYENYCTFFNLPYFSIVSLAFLVPANIQVWDMRYEVTKRNMLKKIEKPFASPPVPGHKV